MASLLKTKVFFVSLILLGIGSSAPELFVTITSHLQQESDIAIGNILGSNIFNILIVGALIFLSTRKIPDTLSMYRSISLLLILTLIAGFLLWDNTLFWWKGILFLGMFMFFFVQSKKSLLEEDSILESSSLKPPILILLFIGGFGLLFFGAKGVISSSIQIGEHLGLSKRLIGLFLISIGTSLPEIAIGLISLFKKKAEIALGSIIGSNVFNTFFIPAIASFIAPIKISSTLLKVDGVVVILASSLLLLSIYLFDKISRVFLSSLFIISYFLYTYFVLLHRTPLN